MKKEFEKKIKSMSPKGSGAWFYREFVKDKVDNVSQAHFDMMLSGSRTMRSDVKNIIMDFLNRD
jgi:hypothetical protein